MVNLRHEISRKMAAQLEQLDDLTCSVCLEQFKEPKLLPCGHRFCNSCLEDVERVDGDTKLPCPQCRALHELSGRGIESFLTDFVAVRQLEYRAVKELASKKAPCGLCSESKQPPTTFCGECDAILCYYCSDAHKRMKPFRDHETVPLEELSLQSFKPKSKAHYCADHPEKTVQVYCELCKKLFCNDCITEIPSGTIRTSSSVEGLERLESFCSHRFSSLSDAVELADARVAELVEKLQDELKKSKEQLECVRKMENSMKRYQDALKTEVNTSVDACIEALQARRVRLLQEADETCTERKQNVCAQKEKVETTLAALTSALQFTKRLKSSDSVERLAMNAHAINLMEKHERVQMWDYRAIPPPLIFHGYEEMQHVKLREFSGRDMVVEVVSQPSPLGLALQPQSLASSNNVPLGEKAQLEITMPNCYAVNEPQFRIQYGSRVRRSIWPEVTQKADNTWTIEFTPCCGGTHEITVYIRGVWINKESPTLMVTGAPSVGTKVRRGPDWKGCSLVQTDDTSKELTGKVESVYPYRSKKGAMYYDKVTVVWSSEPECEHMYPWGGTGDSPRGRGGYEIELAI